MNRPGAKHTKRLLNRLRDRIPEVEFRSTFITGFPGETQRDHEELVNFVKDFRFHRGGFFTYSEEDGTPAAVLDRQIPEEVNRRTKANSTLFDETLTCSWMTSCLDQNGKTR